MVQQRSRDVRVIHQVWRAMRVVYGSVVIVVVSHFVDSGCLAASGRWLVAGGWWLAAGG